MKIIRKIKKKVKKETKKKNKLAIVKSTERESWIKNLRKERSEKEPEKY